MHIYFCELCCIGYCDFVVMFNYVIFVLTGCKLEVINVVCAVYGWCSLLVVLEAESKIV